MGQNYRLWILGLEGDTRRDWILLVRRRNNGAAAYLNSTRSKPCKRRGARFVGVSTACEVSHNDHNVWNRDSQVMRKSVADTPSTIATFESFDLVAFLVRFDALEVLVSVPASSNVISASFNDRCELLK